VDKIKLTQEEKSRKELR